MRQERSSSRQERSSPTHSMLSFQADRPFAFGVHKSERSWRSLAFDEIAIAVDGRPVGDTEKFRQFGQPVFGKDEFLNGGGGALAGNLHGGKPLFGLRQKLLQAGRIRHFRGERRIGL